MEERELLSHVTRKLNLSDGGDKLSQIYETKLTRLSYH